MLVRRSREGDLVREVVSVDLLGAADERVGESLGETNTP